MYRAFIVSSSLLATSLSAQSSQVYDSSKFSQQTADWEDGVRQTVGRSENIREGSTDRAIGDLNFSKDPGRRADEFVRYYQQIPANQRQEYLDNFHKEVQAGNLDNIDFSNLSNKKAGAQ